MFFPPPPKLAHTRNSSGNFGMFVNPYVCDCETCVDYVAEQRPTPTPASLTAAVSSTAPPSPGLAHTRNTRGELGMFVNPSACGCHTCVDYVAEQPAVTLTTVPPRLPTPPTIAEARAADTLMSMSRGVATDTGLYRTFSVGSNDGIGPTYSLASDPHSAPPFPPTGGLGLFSASRGAVSFWTPSHPSASPRFTEEQLATLEVTLRDYASLLVEQQNELDHSGCRSHDEMAAQDAEWDELDRKIAEVDEILAVMGASRDE